MRNKSQSINNLQQRIFQYKYLVLAPQTPPISEAHVQLLVTSELMLTSDVCQAALDWSSQTTTFEHTKLHHIETKPPLRPHNLFMSLLNLTKRALTRPISSTAFIAVGIAFLIFVYKTHSDRSIQQPAITKKMHIQSIPMCEFCTMRFQEFGNAKPLQAMRKWTAPLLERTHRIYTSSTDLLF
jgi:hypothetical protein